MAHDEAERLGIDQLLEWLAGKSVAAVIPSSDIMFRSMSLLLKLTHFPRRFFFSSAFSSSFTRRALDLAFDSANFEISDVSWTKVSGPPVGLPRAVLAVTGD